MKLAAGIVGLPNVGKSTLFNTITNSQVEAANYPFATIQANVGLAKVPDKRLDNLAKLINPESLVHTYCKFIDIAGLVKGASKGEGLGNQFLANIREVDVICHVIRCFEKKQITHVYNSVDPIRDLEIINLELILSDLETLEKRMSKIVSKAKNGDKKALEEERVFKQVYQNLRNNKFINMDEFSLEEQVYISSYNLLTSKKVIYIANIDEEDLINPLNNPHFKKLKQFLKQEQLIPMCINTEYEISKLNILDQELFIKELNIKEPALNNLINVTYKKLNLLTFFTFGKKETRAWSFIKGMKAPECAGIIHSDFQKGFIRVEVIKYEDMIIYQSESKVKEKGKVSIQGKDYLMQDGDICHFRFNV